MKATKVTATATVTDTAMAQVIEQATIAITKNRHEYHGQVEYSPSGRCLVPGAMYVQEVEIREGTSDAKNRDSHTMEPVKRAWIVAVGFEQLDRIDGWVKKCRLICVSETTTGFTNCWLYMRANRSLFSKMAEYQPDGTEINKSQIGGALNNIPLKTVNDLTDKALAGSPWMASYLDKLGTRIAVPEVTITY